ncbi:ABC transporter substrate-binding protein [Streptomyces sp. NPDC004629]|uniref:ABC transporter substrate-binding protein n=1 Tax=Streptomyces sp. NPDC004629 TaxID=3364705 RepID=UPI0036C51B89
MAPTDPLRRRDFLRLGTAATGTLATGGLAGLLSACGTSPSSDTQLVYAGYGGSYQSSMKEAMFGPFAKQAGLTVKYTADANDVSKLSAMAKADRSQDDIADAQGPALAQLRSTGALAKLDTSVLNSADLAKPDLATAYSVPYYQFSHNIFWNAAKIDGKLASWADVWDVEKFPGKRGFQRLPWFTLEIALIADGVAIEKLYPLDVDRAFQSLDRIKPHAVFLDNNSLTNAVSTGEIVTADLNLARVKTIQQSGVKLEYTWNEAMLDVEQLVVLRGGPNPDAAQKAVRYSLRPQTQLRIMNKLGYTPTSKAALAKIPADQAKDLPGTEQTLDHSFYLDSEWWMKNYAAVSERFQSWLSS